VRKIKMVHVIITDPEDCEGIYYLSLTDDQKNLLDFLERKYLLGSEVQIQTVDIHSFETV
jgi:hypothetical protein